MPVIRRDDGIQFAIQTYRELLSAKSLSLLKNEIRLLSQQHGEYIRLFRSSKNAIEAVFSRDPGFLLGESIWYYFGRPANLIYCEELPGAQQALVIVVKSSTIYLDTKIPYSSLIDEFATLLTGHNRYDVHLYGNVPLSDQPEPGKFIFQPEQLASLHRLDKSLLSQLAMDEGLELQPLELALRSDIFSKTAEVKYVIYGVIALIVIIIAYYQFTAREKVTPAVQQIVYTTPESTYDKFLMTPAPGRILNEVGQAVILMSTAPGWSPISVIYNGGSYTFRMTEVGGDLTLLRRWALRRKFDIAFTQTGVEITVPSVITPRSRPEEIFLNQSVLATLIDQVNHLLGRQHVSLGTSKSVDSYQQTELIINVTNAAPGMLDLLSRTFTNMPIAMKNLQFNIANGLMSGTITLTVIGK